MNPFKELEIKGVYLAEGKKNEDSRGWLMETFRQDWLENADLRMALPVMSYISMTHPGVARGPHEHREQIDYFAFLGPSDFKIYLWDNRPGSSTYRQKIQLLLGESRPGILLVPPGVVHAYKNVGEVDGLVLNYPNQLYAGWNKEKPVDEIRHENDPHSEFKLED